jgi:hypothetical protein
MVGDGGVVEVREVANAGAETDALDGQSTDFVRKKGKTDRRFGVQPAARLEAGISQGFGGGGEGVLGEGGGLSQFLEAAVGGEKC